MCLTKPATSVSARMSPIPEDAVLGMSPCSSPPGLPHPSEAPHIAMPKVSPPPGLPHPSEPVPLQSVRCNSSSQVVCAPPPGLARIVREVWNWNFKEEVDTLLSVAANIGSNAVIALDTEFSGFLVQEARMLDENMQYKVLRDNVNLLRPIQIGFAVASADGTLHGVWNFNLSFDVDFDLHTEASLQFLRRAGIDFHRHATEGVQATLLGQQLANSRLISSHAEAPLWVTFSGLYDLGYFLNLVSDKPLPSEPSSYSKALAIAFPKRFDLRERLPWGSLESLVNMHSIERCGVAHTAASDALATLDLLLRVIDVPCAHLVRDERHHEPSREGLADVTIAHELPAEIENLKAMSSSAAPSTSWGAAARCAAVAAMAPWRCVQTSLPPVIAGKSAAVAA